MRSYCIPKPHIVYEVLNTEVIIVDFTTGNYYALIHIAKQVWQLIEQCVPIEKIARLLSDHYGRTEESILVDLETFFDQLLENGLIQETAEEGPTNLTLMDSEGWVYDAPRLQKYTDVQSLLLLDPIHEVSEVGWPVKHE